MNVFRITLILVLLIKLQIVAAQWKNETFGTFGANQVSDGHFISLASLAYYQHDNFIFGGGIQTGKLNSSFEIPDFRIETSIDFKLKTIPFNSELFYTKHFISENLQEGNLAILLVYKKDPFEFAIGNSFRKYSFRREFDKLQSNSLKENWNLIYCLRWHPFKNDTWKVSTEITNYDYFLIHQETNPMFNMKAEYKINESLNSFFELWYKSAGAFNLNVNYFGYLFRTGVRWQF